MNKFWRQVFRRPYRLGRSIDRSDSTIQNSQNSSLSQNAASFKAASYLASSSGSAQPKIVAFSSPDFISRIHSDHAAASSPSTRFQTFPRLARLIRSFRPGELTVFTGPTGSGKTTVLSQLSLDYCFQGVRTLWGSFEIRNTRLARIMLEQVSGISGDCESEAGDEAGAGEMAGDIATASLDANVDTNLHSNRQLLNAQNVLKQIPLFFMDYFGSVPLDTVLTCMDSAVSEHGIQHIILDNLQFMLSGQHTSSLDKFDLTDRCVAALRAFATSRNVHLTLVIHPRKELDDTPLGLASVSGTAKATQEADNVIILQKVGEARYLDVKKNRYDGELGTVRIKFNPQSRLVYEE